MKQIPLIQVVTKVSTENPWWNSPHKISANYDEFQPRPYLDLFFPLATQREVNRAIVLMGPRRVGKTVLIHHVIKRLLESGSKPTSLCYISVDQPLYNGLRLDQILEAYSAAASVDLQRDDLFVFFDEVQYLKDWEVHLKTLVDRFQNIQFVASGSAAAALKLSSRESGAGRFTDFLLPPLTFHEYLTLLDAQHLIDSTVSNTGFILDVRCADIEGLNKHFLTYLNFGGYPEVAFSKMIQQDPARYVKSDIIDKVLLRDLPSLYGVQDVQELNYLFTTLAYNTAG